MARQLLLRQRQLLLVLLLLLLLLLPEGWAPGFTACVPLRYGADCTYPPVNLSSITLVLFLALTRSRQPVDFLVGAGSSECACAEYEDCDDGVAGSGACSCSFGREVDCGIPSRLVPPPATLTPCMASDSRTRCSLEEVVLQPISDRLRLDRQTSRAPRQVVNATLVSVLPTPLHATRLRLLASDSEVAELLGLDPASWLDPPGSARFTELFTGRQLFPGSVPYSHVYGGHQFGSWSGQLGDGRAISLGELRGFEISLKGSGKTPLSRAGDGRAVLQSLCREFLGGAALVALGVPSTRALAVIGTDDPSDAVLRDEWYSGQVTQKRAGVLVRVSPTFLRFGSFQLAAKRQGVAGVLELARFALHKIALLETKDDASAAYLHRAVLYGGAEGVDSSVRARCFFTARREPSCAARAATELEPEPVLRCLLRRVVERCAALVAAWTATGFAHGVMNTDNMSILCISLDLNVYGFMERYSERYVPNKIDDEGRYAFGQQPEMMRWNIMRLASALGGTSYPQDYEPDARSWSTAGQLDGALGDGSGWLSSSARAAELSAFDGVYHQCLEVRLRLRLGLPPNNAAGSDQHGQQVSDSVGAGAAVQQFVDFLAKSGADMYRGYRALASIPLSSLSKELEAQQKAAGGRQAVVASRLLAITQHVANAGGVSAKWFEANQEHCMKAIGALIAAVSRSLPSSTTQNNRSQPPVAVWQRHLAAMNPSFPLRTEGLREVTTFAAEDPDHGAKALGAMLEYVKNPYSDLNISKGQPHNSDECCAGGTCSAPNGRPTAAERVVTSVMEGMRGPPEVSAGAAPPQTSCGGQ